MAVLRSSQPNPQRNKQNKWKMYAIKQIEICAEYRDMLPRPRLDLSGTPGLRPIGLSPGSWQTSLGLGSMSRYSAQILICITKRIPRFQMIWLRKEPRHQGHDTDPGFSLNSRLQYLYGYTDNYVAIWQFGMIIHLHLFFLLPSFYIVIFIYQPLDVMAVNTLRWHVTKPLMYWCWIKGYPVVKYDILGTGRKGKYFCCGQTNYALIDITCHI